MWETGIPPALFARLYVNWRRVRRETKVASDVFSRMGIRRLVEFGCGVGRHGYLLSKKGFSVLLTDVKDWRYGAARSLPFQEYDVLRGGELKWDFEGGYAFGLFIVLEYKDLLKAFENLGELMGKRPLLFDYNFIVHPEPKVREVRLRGRKYIALVRREEVIPIDGGFRYNYRIEVMDESGSVVGVEDTGYPVYSKEKVFEAIRRAGLEIAEIMWASWDSEKNEYKFTRKKDSAFIVVRRAIS
ncbi:MAG: hypothetical protein N3F67_02000 [Acidilobaceae archaeon]|nr:hypothetical protein [Acidilobaceae archaeon]